MFLCTDRFHRTQDMAIIITYKKTGCPASTGQPVFGRV